MNQIDQLLRALNPRLVFEDQVLPEVIKPQFYAHIHKEALTIAAIAPIEPSDDKLFGLAIEHDQAMKFMVGTDSTTNWSVALKDGQYGIIKNEDLRGRNSRVDVISILEVPWGLVQSADIKVVVDADNSQAEIFYDGSKMPNWKSSAKLYFTREGDPSYLKCAFSLDVNILETLKKVNKAAEWPNPIILPLNEVDDLSIFTMKSDLKISLIKKNETSSNGI